LKQLKHYRQPESGTVNPVASPLKNRVLPYSGSARPDTDSSANCLRVTDRGLNLNEMGHKEPSERKDVETQREGSAAMLEETGWAPIGHPLGRITARPSRAPVREL
jgi:hypothetical protein